MKTLKRWFKDFFIVPTFILFFFFLPIVLILLYGCETLPAERVPDICSCQKASKSLYYCQCGQLDCVISDYRMNLSCVKMR